MSEKTRIAVIIPCFNEGPAIAKVVDDFEQALPDAMVYVYDNNSCDDTKNKAAMAGAVVRSEYRQGKGNVIRRAFADVDADVYVMVDGDGTYDANAAQHMITTLINESLDMVVAARVDHSCAYRPGHRIGNYLFSHTVAWLFGRQFADVLSGYRVLSRRFVKSFPVVASGFEIEVMIAIHALQLRMPCREHTTRYFQRADGTHSKLSTWRDGVHILWAIVTLLKDVKPALFYGVLSALLTLMSLGLGTSIIIEFIHTGLVPRFPSAILATGMMLMAAIFLICGLILASVSKGRLESKNLIYLNIPGPANFRSDDQE